MESITKELQRVGKKHPLLLIKIFEEVNLTKTELKVLKQRYIEELSFKEIAYNIGKSERHIFRCHKTGVKKTVEKFGMADLLDFLCQQKAISAPL